MQELEKKITEPGFVGSKHTSGDKTYVVALADNFSYMDPVDRSVAMKQVSLVLRTGCINQSKILFKFKTTFDSSFYKSFNYRQKLRYHWFR